MTERDMNHYGHVHEPGVLNYWPEQEERRRQVAEARENRRSVREKFAELVIVAGLSVGFGGSVGVITESFTDNAEVSSVAAVAVSGACFTGGAVYLNRRERQA